jgi:hypothetical protein
MLKRGGFQVARSFRRKIANLQAQDFEKPHFGHRKHGQSF